MEAIMVHKKTVRDLELAGQRVLARVDFNVPMDEAGQITSDHRIQAALPTLRYCLEHDAKLVLMSHLGRPGGQPDEKLSLQPIADRLQQMLEGVRVRLVKDYADWSPGEQDSREIILLENLRFHEGEKAGDEAFAEQLARFGEIYVNDAFGTCHRKHASMFAVPKHFPEGHRVIGFLVEQELAALDELRESPEHPMVAILGGAKVSDKIEVVECLLDRADLVLIGGAMAYTFMKAKAMNVGASKVEEDKLDIARRLIDEAGDNLMLPVDHVIADQPDADGKIEVADGGIPDGWYGMDIGPKTVGHFTEQIKDAATILWNGPVGKFEDEPFLSGTLSIVRSMAAAEGKAFVGGGESSQAVEQFGMLDRIDHVSTGGGAFLKYLQGSELPALTVIDQQSAEMPERSS